MKGTLGVKGFTWQLQIKDKDGHEVDEETKANLIPTVGMNFLVRSPFGDVTPESTFYLGLFRGNYIPSPGSTSADIPSGMVEFIDYSEAQRPLWDRSFTGQAGMDNSISKATFTVTQDRTIRGAFLVSKADKGGSTGLLLSVVRFATPKDVSAGQEISLSGGVIYVSTNVI